MKKYFSLLLAAILLVGCGSSKVESNQNEVVQNQEKQKESIPFTYSSQVDEFSINGTKMVKEEYEERNMTIYVAEFEITNNGRDIYYLDKGQAINDNMEEVTLNPGDTKICKSYAELREDGNYVIDFYVPLYSSLENQNENTIVKTLSEWIFVDSKTGKGLDSEGMIEQEANMGETITVMDEPDFQVIAKDLYGDGEVYSVTFNNLSSHPVKILYNGIELSPGESCTIEAYRYSQFRIYQVDEVEVCGKAATEDYGKTTDHGYIDANGTEYCYKMMASIYDFKLEN